MSPSRSRRRNRKTPLSPSTPPAFGETANQNIVTSYRWGWYLLSFFVPFSGIFIALLLYDQDSREVRKIGRNCLLIGFVVWVVFPVLMLLGLIFLGAMAALSWISDAVPSAD